MSQDNLGPCSIVVVGTPAEIAPEIAAGILAAYGLRRCYRLGEVNAITSHGSLYFTRALNEDEYATSLRFLRQLPLNVYSWEVAYERYCSLRSSAGLQTSLGCEGDGLIPPKNLAATPADIAVYNQISDNYFASVKGIPLIVAAQRALYALDNAKALSPCPLYNDAAAELRAALKSPAVTVKENKS